MKFRFNDREESKEVERYYERYCMEFDVNSESVIVHNQICTAYMHGSLLAMGQVEDIGRHDDSSSALHSARRSYPEAAPCFDCCRSSQQ